MRDQRPESAPPPLISFGSPGGWRAAGLAVVASSLATLTAWWLAQHWLAAPLVEALSWAVGFATLIVVYRCARMPKPLSAKVALLAWALVAGLALAVHLLLASFRAWAG